MDDEQQLHKDHKGNSEGQVDNTQALKKYTACLDALHEEAKTGRRQTVAGPRVYAVIKKCFGDLGLGPEAWNALGISG